MGCRMSRKEATEVFLKIVRKGHIFLILRINTWFGTNNMSHRKKSAETRWSQPTDAKQSWTAAPGPCSFILLLLATTTPVNKTNKSGPSFQGQCGSLVSQPSWRRLGFPWESLCKSLSTSDNRNACTIHSRQGTFGSFSIALACLSI